MKPEYVSDKEAAIRFAVTRNTIRKWVRVNPEFPRPIKLSEGCTRWRVADLDAWASKQMEGAR
jgi:prophage regulatory protein